MGLHRGVAHRGRVVFHVHREGGLLHGAVQVPLRGLLGPGLLVFRLRGKDHGLVAAVLVFGACGQTRVADGVTVGAYSLLTDSVLEGGVTVRLGDRSGAA